MWFLSVAQARKQGRIPEVKSYDFDGGARVFFLFGSQTVQLRKLQVGLSENVGYIPNEIAIFHRDNDQQNHWVQWGTQHFQ